MPAEVLPWPRVIAILHRVAAEAELGPEAHVGGVQEDLTIVHGVVGVANKSGIFEEGRHLPDERQPRARLDSHYSKSFLGVHAEPAAILHPQDDPEGADRIFALLAVHQDGDDEFIIGRPSQNLAHLLALSESQEALPVLPNRPADSHNFPLRR